MLPAAAAQITVEKMLTLPREFLMSLMSASDTRRSCLSVTGIFKLAKATCGMIKACSARLARC